MDQDAIVIQCGFAVMNILSLPESDSIVFIEETVSYLQSVRGTSEAVNRIGEALCRYTMFDLQYIGGFIHREVGKLPDPYRRMYRPYSLDLLHQYHEVLYVYRFGGVSDAPLPNPILWHEFWDIARSQCFVRRERSDDPFPQMRHPLSAFFYRLVYGYVMLIAGGYGHPVGMPFPGGARVHREGGRILCPIRNKERDLPFALCNFCSAEQDPRYG